MWPPDADFPPDPCPAASGPTFRSSSSPVLSEYAVTILILRQEYLHGSSLTPALHGLLLAASREPVEEESGEQQAENCEHHGDQSGRRAGRGNPRTRPGPGRPWPPRRRSPTPVPCRGSRAIRSERPVLYVLLVEFRFHLTGELGAKRSLIVCIFGKNHRRIHIPERGVPESSPEACPEDPVPPVFCSEGPALRDACCSSRACEEPPPRSQHRRNRPRASPPARQG